MHYTGERTKFAFISISPKDVCAHCSVLVFPSSFFFENRVRTSESDILDGGEGGKIS